MSRTMVVGGTILVVMRDMDEENEVYWDRAWCFASEMDRISRAARQTTKDLPSRDMIEAAWQTSLKRPHERRGASYDRVYTSLDA